MAVIDREDYEEPQCLLDMKRGQANRPAATVPMGRIIEKLDEHLGRDDWGAAERHLDYWLAEAMADGDLKGALAIEGERMGLFRKRGREEDAMRAVAHAEELLEEAGMHGTVTGATAFINIATVCKTFGHSKESLPYFEEARAIYEKHLPQNDGRLGGLYNNLALALTDLSRYEDALSYYEKALSVMEQVENGALEQAVTYLNMADLFALRDGYEAAEDRIQALLDTGWEKLMTPSLPHDGYYAYVCETCSPTFDYYGRFADGAELKETARAIYHS